MDEARLEGSVRAVRRTCECVLYKPETWSADAVMLAKALLAITRDTERVQFDSPAFDLHGKKHQQICTSVGKMSGDVV